MKPYATRFGFTFGAMDVRAGFCDDRKGWAVTLIETPKTRLQIYVTKTGKVRVHDSKGREWKPLEEQQT